MGNEVTDTEKRLVEHNRAVELPRPINRTFVTTLFLDTSHKMRTVEVGLKRSKSREARRGRSVNRRHEAFYM